MSDRVQRNPNPMPDAGGRSDVLSTPSDAAPARAPTTAREAEARQLDQLIEDFCRAARVAVETPVPAEEAPPVRSRSPGWSAKSLRAVVAAGTPGSHSPGERADWRLFVKATTAGFAIGLLAFALVHSGLLGRQTATETEQSEHPAAGKSWQTAQDAATPNGAMPAATERTKPRVMLHANPALTIVSDPSGKRQPPPPAATLPLPEIRFSTWPVGNDTLQQTGEPPKRWDFLHSTTGAVKPAPRTASTKVPLKVPLPTRLAPADRDQHKGDEKPLADEKPIDPDPDQKTVAPGPPAGRDRATPRRTVRRRTTRKFLLGRGTPREPKVERKPRRHTGDHHRTKQNRPAGTRRPAGARSGGGQGDPALRPPVEPPPHPRPRPAVGPRADKSGEARLQVSQQPDADSEDTTGGFLGFLRPRPQPAWARPAVEH